MLSRNKSIFHVGDGGGEATMTVVSIRELKCGKPAREEGMEGLRILIHHKELQGSNVVIKSKMPTCKLIPQACCPSKGLGFLKTCFLCKRELSPCKDVYMYRGDQGFCSEECRSRKILVDEREEFEIEARKRLRAPHRHHHHHHHHHHHTSTKVLKSDRNRIPAVA